MHPGLGSAANVSVVEEGCQVTLRYYGGICSQPPAMPFRYDCPSHGAALNMIESAFRVWNGHTDEEGKLSLFDTPKRPHLALPKVPPYPIFDGYVVPFGTDGQPLPGLNVTETVTGECFEDDLAAPDLGYPVRCFWGHSLHNECFKPPGSLEVEGFALCPDYWRSPNPMSFFKVLISADD